MDKRLRWLNNLLCFEVAARHQSYSKAAEELSISQAAVSQKMRQLEDCLNVRLFTRQARNMALTAQGKVLLASCQRGFSDIVEGLNQVQEAPVEGALTVSSTQAFCALWLVPRLIDFYNAQSHININVLGSNRVEDLNDGKIDVAIRFSTSSTHLHKPSLVVEQIGDNPVFPVCAPSVAARLSATHPKDLLSARLFSLAHENRVNWETWFESAHVNIHQTSLNKTEVTSSDLALSAVLAGHGVMLASDIMVGEYLKSGQLVVPVDFPHPVSWKAHLVYLKNSPKHKRIKVFCDWLKAQMPFDEPGGKTG